MTIAGFRVDQSLDKERVAQNLRASREGTGEGVRVTLFEGAEAQSLDAALAESRQVSEAGSYHVLSYSEKGVTAEGVPFLVGPDVPGPSLKELLGQRGGLKLDVLVSVAIQVTRALKAAHDLGIAHYDLSPYNIYLSDAAGGLVRVDRFGARHMAPLYSSKLKTEVFYGTPEYLAPEICGGKEVDVRADFYSLALVLYEAVTAKPPFVSNSYKTTVKRQVYEKPLPLHLVKPGMPHVAEFEKLVAKASQKDPKLRFQSAAELLEALEAFRAACFADVEVPADPGASADEATIAAARPAPAPAPPAPVADGTIEPVKPEDVASKKHSTLVFGGLKVPPRAARRNRTAEPASEPVGSYEPAPPGQVAAEPEPAPAPRSPESETLPAMAAVSAPEPQPAPAEAPAPQKFHSKPTLLFEAVTDTVIEEAARTEPAAAAAPAAEEAAPVAATPAVAAPKAELAKPSMKKKSAAERLSEPDTVLEVIKGGAADRAADDKDDKFPGPVRAEEMEDWFVDSNEGLAAGEGPGGKKKDRNVVFWIVGVAAVAAVAIFAVVLSLETQDKVPQQTPRAPTTDVAIQAAPSAPIAAPALAVAPMPPVAAPSAPPAMVPSDGQPSREELAAEFAKGDDEPAPTPAVEPAAPPAEGVPAEGQPNGGEPPAPVAGDIAAVEKAEAAKVAADLAAADKAAADKVAADKAAADKAEADKAAADKAAADKAAAEKAALAKAAAEKAAAEKAAAKEAALVEKPRDKAAEEKAAARKAAAEKAAAERAIARKAAAEKAAAAKLAAKEKAAAAKAAAAAAADKEKAAAPDKAAAAEKAAADKEKAAADKAAKEKAAADKAEAAKTPEPGVDDTKAQSQKMIGLGHKAMKAGNFKLALLYYGKAKALDKENSMADKFIGMAQQKLAESKEGGAP